MKQRWIKAALIIICSVIAANGVAKEGVNGKEVRIENWGHFFKGYRGCFVMYDRNRERYHFYNRKHCEQRFSPASTYKVPHALIGLETEVLKDENALFKWNGIRHKFKVWNRDHTLKTAIPYSVLWYFQKVASKVGKKRMQKMVNRFDYGNRDISAPLTTFWLESSLKISPLEQIHFLQRFYNYQLSASNKNIDRVKEILILSDKEKERLSGKTGTGVVNGQFVNGWFVGYLEKEKNLYFFATNLQASYNANGLKAKRITLKILKEKLLFDV